MDANITIVNEVGVDPGIDHMLAMQCFDEVRHAGGKVEFSFLLLSNLSNHYKFVDTVMFVLL